jgi:hypothetical protein
MSTPLLLQGLAITAVVGWSVLFAAHRLLPVTTRRVQARAIELLDRPGSPVWLHELALRLQPKATTGASCGDGCSSCGGCAAAAAQPVADEPLPLTFRPRTKA